MISSIAIQDNILEKVKSGKFDAAWFPISYQKDGHTVEVSFMSDALFVDDFERVNVTAETQQKICDLINGSLMTPFLCDVLWYNATIKHLPKTQPITSTVEAGISHSRLIDADHPRDLTKLRANMGKQWCLSKSLQENSSAAVNYGWYVPKEFVIHNTWRGIKVYNPRHASQKDLFVIQEPATAHNFRHVDYSQICQCVSQYMKIDGKEYRMEDVLLSDNANLITNTGKLSVNRQPGVKKQVSVTVLFPEYIRV